MYLFEDWESDFSQDITNGEVGLRSQTKRRVSQLERGWVRGAMRGWPTAARKAEQMITIPFAEQIQHTTSCVERRDNRNWSVAPRRDAVGWHDDSREQGRTDIEED